MSRENLPNRRSHETTKVRHWDQNWIIGIGRAGTDMQIQEIFINSGKSGTQIETVARDAAIIMSIGLQYGVPIEVLKNAVTRNTDGSPSGPMGAILDHLTGEDSNDTGNNMDK